MEAGGIISRIKRLKIAIISYFEDQMLIAAEVKPNMFSTFMQFQLKLYFRRKKNCHFKLF